MIVTNTDKDSINVKIKSTVKIIKCQCTAEGDKKCTDDNDKKCTADDGEKNSSPYLIKKDDIKKSGFVRSGFDYGTLVVPFKYQLTGNNDFTGSASLGGYAGYQFESIHYLGLSTIPIIFAGASNISVPGSNGTDSKNVMGFTYGLGLIFKFNGGFQLGGIMGWDRIGENNNYQYNGKPWVAMEIGYSFLQP